jgi:hypothetical protein
LDSYIQNLFDIDDNPDFWITLVKSWHLALSSQDPAANDSLRYARFLFSLILKGLTLALNKAGLFGTEFCFFGAGHGFLAVGFFFKPSVLFFRCCLSTK